MENSIIRKLTKGKRTAFIIAFILFLCYCVFVLIYNNLVSFQTDCLVVAVFLSFIFLITIDDHTKSTMPIHWITLFAGLSLFALSIGLEINKLEMDKELNSASIIGVPLFLVVISIVSLISFFVISVESIRLRIKHNFAIPLIILVIAALSLAAAYLM